MERNRPGEAVEVYFDESSTTRDYLAQARTWSPPDGRVPRLLPRLHFPQFIGARRMGRSLDAQEAHVIGGVALHGALVPDRIPLLVWLGTTIGDERRTVMPYQTGGRKVLHKTTLPFLDRLETAVLKRARRVLAQSRHTAAVLLREGIDPARVEVQPVPVDTERFRPGPGERRGVLFVGRATDPRKAFGRLARVVAASPIVREHGVDVVSESEPDRGAVGGAIRWHGEVDDLPERYRGARAFALTSVQEGLGIVVFEALSSGTPVVAMRCGGPDAFIEESGGGYVVDDEDAFRGKVEQVLTDDDLARELGEAGRAYVETRMSASRFLDDPGIFRL
jgi:glycosyltransferase involved in cell wall biosynthesis